MKRKDPLNKVVGKTNLTNEENYSFLGKRDMFIIRTDW